MHDPAILPPSLLPFVQIFQRKSPAEKKVGICAPGCRVGCACVWNALGRPLYLGFSFLTFIFFLLWRSASLPHTQLRSARTKLEGYKSQLLKHLGSTKTRITALEASVAAVRKQALFKLKTVYTWGPSLECC